VVVPSSDPDAGGSSHEAMAISRSDVYALEGKAERAVQSPWLERFARLGLATQGVVYLVIGGLAAKTALGRSGKTTGSNGALREIAAQPYGQVMLAVVGVGLVGYALFRLIEAVLDTECKGKKPKGIVTRIGYAFSGLAYVGLAFGAFRLLTAGESKDDGANARTLTGRLLEQPGGRWMVAAVAVIVFMVAIIQFYKAVTSKFQRTLEQERMGDRLLRWTVRIGRVGYAARGIVFGVIGGLIMKAAIDNDPSGSSGLPGALTALREQPYGPWVLLAVALGLMTFATYCLLRAPYRRIQRR